MVVSKFVPTKNGRFQILHMSDQQALNKVIKSRITFGLGHQNSWHQDLKDSFLFYAADPNDFLWRMKVNDVDGFELGTCVCALLYLVLRQAHSSCHIRPVIRIWKECNNNINYKRHARTANVFFPGEEWEKNWESVKYCSERYKKIKNK